MRDVGYSTFCKLYLFHSSLFVWWQKIHIPYIFNCPYPSSSPSWNSELLLRLRDGIVSHRLYCNRFRGCHTLTGKEFNNDKLGTTINAIHSSPLATATKSEGLYPVIFSARVMLTANLWPEVGLGFRQTNLPIAVLIQFHNYSGPLTTAYQLWYLENTITLVNSSYAMQHKSQGQTLQNGSRKSRISCRLHICVRRL